MSVIAFVSQKGGSGKTTTAVHLAAYAANQNKLTILLDLDPQGSAIEWYDTKKGRNFLAKKIILKDLPKYLETSKKGGADLVIIDTAGHADAAAAEAAKKADLVLIPCRPSRFDVGTIPKTFSTIKLNKKTAFVLMNVCPMGNLSQEMKEGLKEKGFPVLDVMISQRVAFSHAVVDGGCVHDYDPKGQAAKDIENLYGFVKERFKL